jgi:hypothetical protein
MKRFFLRFASLLAQAWRSSLVAIRAFVVWVSPTHRFLASLLVLVFVVSVLSWAIFDVRSTYILFFPTVTRGNLRGEARDLPRRFGAEGRAELLASEFLLGPRDPGLVPALPAGTTLAAVLLRKGTLYVDLGEEAALPPRPDIERALDALDKTLRQGIPPARRIVLTIGGQEPWKEGLPSPTAGTSQGGKKR